MDNDNPQFALVLGLAFLLVGILGFVPAALTHPAVTGHDLRVQFADGYLFGLFHVNAVHSAVHITSAGGGSRNGPSALRRRGGPRSP